MGLFIAIVLFGGALLNGGFQTGQKNPDANGILDSDPHIVTYDKE